MIIISERFEVDGEVCIRGRFNGFNFACVRIDTDIDYGFQPITYLPAFKDEKTDMPEEVYEDLIEELNSTTTWR